MNDEQDYLAVVNAAKALLKASKERTKKSEKYRDMNFQDYTIKARAGASDRLTNACFAFDMAKDQMHKVLVDAFLTKPKEREAYDTVNLSHGCGFGHSITFKYTPPLPRCYE